ncbi:MAG: hypothetical protein ABW321_15165, partial [Polyangiales bacterium]
RKAGVAERGEWQRDAARRYALQGSADDREPDVLAAGPVRVVLSVAGGVVFGLLPDAAFSGGLGAELAVGPWLLGLRVLFRGPGAERVQVPGADRSEDAARFWGLGGGIVGCGAWPVSALGVGLCLSPQLAMLRGAAEALGVSQRVAVAPWYSVGASLLVTWPRDSRLQLRLEPGLQVSLNRPRFEIEGLGLVHHVPGVVPQLTAALAFGF